MNIPIRVLISLTKKELAACPPKRRDYVRRRLKALERAQQIRREVRAA